GVTALAAACSSRAWVTADRPSTSLSSSPTGVSRSIPTAPGQSTANTTSATTVSSSPVATTTPTPPAGSNQEPSPATAPAGASTPLSAGGVGLWPAAGQAALTFDDGPGDATAAVLDILEGDKVPATFFVVGRA